jgi:Trm5-related predicted tRNA methylase
LKEIEKFILDVNDWVHEKVDELKTLAPQQESNPAMMRKELSSRQLDLAHAEIQAQIQAKAQAEEMMRQQAQNKINAQKQKER